MRIPSISCSILETRAPTMSASQQDSENPRPKPGRRRPNPDRFKYRSQRQTRPGNRVGQSDHTIESGPVEGRNSSVDNTRSRGRVSNLRYLTKTASNPYNQAGTSVESRNPLVELTTPESVQCDSSGAQLRSNSLECMICCDIVRRVTPIWYCPSCYNIFHLKCAIEWCNKSVKSRNEALAASQYPQLGDDQTDQRQPRQDYQRRRGCSIEWPCPACREILHSRPSKYKCFCGKVISPDVNRNLIPHSCGQLCGRKRPNATCPHTCNALCHPGRCATCPLTSKKSCFCGKRVREEKCSSEVSSCEQVCGKTLSCGVHTCDRTCHPGGCPSCEVTLTVTCNCGDQQSPMPCEAVGLALEEGKYQLSCDKTCGKLLDCKNHLCEEKCHPGECTSCKLLSWNLELCPCGSTKIDNNLVSNRESCLDPVPTCGNRCNRQLICGPEKNHHRCGRKCHSGNCPPCKLKTNAHCECGLTSKTLDCSLFFSKVTDGGKVTFKQVAHSFNCEVRCTKLKSCARHRCNIKCCKYLKQPQLHKCEQICNRKLACGLHNCSEPCHPGQCGDCANIGWEELTCHCGASVLYPPIPCGSRRPVCNRPCRRTHECGHQVKHECHDDTETCPPCTVFVNRSCFCKVESKDNVYCYQSGYSCGRTCKRKLPCGQHECNRVCHDGPCQGSDRACTKPCPIVRYSCKHPCGMPCHSVSACPPSECKRVVEVTCKCGNKVDRMSCSKLMKDVDNRSRLAMMSIGKLNQDELIIDLTSDATSEQDPNHKNFLKRLECDETCVILERNKALAEALNVAQPDLKPVSIFGEDPLKLLKEATALDYKFVADTFTSLEKFVKQVKESEKRFLFLQFPPCERLRREIVHELAHHFNCTSDSRGEDPFKQVVVKAHKNKSCVPDFTIEQLLPSTD